MPESPTTAIRLVTERKLIRLGELELECAVGQLADETYVDLLIGKKLHEVFGGANRGQHENIELIGSSPDMSELIHPRGPR